MITTLITGASRGIGLEMARLCAERGDTVIACCRKRSEGLESLGLRVESGVDVSSDADVAAARSISYRARSPSPCSTPVTCAPT